MQLQHTILSDFHRNKIQKYNSYLWKEHRILPTSLKKITQSSALSALIHFLLLLLRAISNHAYIPRTHATTIQFTNTFKKFSLRWIAGQTEDLNQKLISRLTVHFVIKRNYILLRNILIIITLINIMNSKAF